MDYGVTFGLGKDGSMRSPHQNDERTTFMLPKMSVYYVARLMGRDAAPVTYYLGTGDGILNYSTFKCSVTGDVFERPVTGERFTAHDSEWVSTYDHVSPPTFIAAGPARPEEVREEEGNAGYRAVLWLKEFFKSTQIAACQIAGVPEATFYVWQNNPSAGMRSAGGRQALKLRASLEVAIARLGTEAVYRFVSAGSPSIEDRLRRLRGAPWEQAVSEIAQFGTYDVAESLPRILSPDEYLRRVREVDEQAINPRTGDGARLMSEGEIREADQEGR